MRTPATGTPPVASLVRPLIVRAIGVALGSDVVPGLDVAVGADVKVGAGGVGDTALAERSGVVWAAGVDEAPL